MEAEYQKLKA